MYRCMRLPMLGARCLQKASEGGEEDLMEELNRFEDDLYTKFFSAASTDKVLADSGPQGINSNR